ncbi:uncharacterized protein TRAVEDRAFT_54612 [Trametes versicolor FP-101664 SS1]|uniref:Uncharacterized protein n=1 Tax=Trametes versicolor (strain FP-101664) TaxID=717944 RepID=R7S711_TRAVS|nr:uncharacterized protein TRAVEDRAFT_54612 [Trametes versicolor FP-101664 SS1]EIW51385.1 hypothetical protein TRAVEDRAFT_54612 [Trametes versicolor FP-101664 SS1]
MKVMADQQASVLRDMKTVQEKQADALAAMAGSRKAAPSTSRPGRRTNAEDEMDIDDGELADDEEAAIPIPSRKGKKPKLQGPPVEQDPQRKKFLVRSNYEGVYGI